MSYLGVNLWFRRLALFFFCLLGIHEGHATDHSDKIAVGKRLYEEGLLPDGSPLTATSTEGVTLKGVHATCVSCHRKSGMGGVEGQTVIPPITSKFLFARKEKPLAIVDPKNKMGFNMPQVSYNRASLERALTVGVGVDDRTLSIAMPRYNLDDASMDGLFSYLGQLSGQLSEGIDEENIYFATYFTPDTPSDVRRVLIKGMESYFEERNVSWQDNRRHHRVGFDVYPRTPRNWRLAVWDLQGNPDSWRGQLETYYKQRPVFAVLSGVALNVSEPIAEFCQGKKLPCLFGTSNDIGGSPRNYSFYFNKGLELEAQILAMKLRELPKRGRRIMQIIQDIPSSQRVAIKVSELLRLEGIEQVACVVSNPYNAGVKKCLAETQHRDDVVLWLDKSALPWLPKKPPDVSSIYFSSLLAGEQAIPSGEAWEKKGFLLSLFELPAKRLPHLANFYGWVTRHHLPAVDERIQADNFFVLQLISELTAQMLDNLYRDYLIERTEDILGMGFNQSIYPELSLAPGQRIASHSGYIAQRSKRGLISIGGRILP